MGFRRSRTARRMASFHRIARLNLKSRFLSYRVPGTAVMYKPNGLDSCDAEQDIESPNFASSRLTSRMTMTDWTDRRVSRPIRVFGPGRHRIWLRLESTAFRHADL
jgi:hypothetical protein